MKEILKLGGRKEHSIFNWIGREELRIGAIEGLRIEEIFRVCKEGIWKGW